MKRKEESIGGKTTKSVDNRAVKKNVSSNSSTIRVQNPKNSKAITQKPPPSNSSSFLPPCKTSASKGANEKKKKKVGAKRVRAIVERDGGKAARNEGEEQRRSEEEARTEVLRNMLGTLAYSIMIVPHRNSRNENVRNVASYWCNFPMPVDNTSAITSTNVTGSIRTIVKELLTQNIDLSIEMLKLDEDKSEYSVKLNLFVNKPHFAIASNFLNNSETLIVMQCIRDHKQIFDKHEYDSSRNKLTLSKMKPQLRFKLEPQLVIMSFCYGLLLEGLLTRKYMDVKDILVLSLREMLEDAHSSLSEESKRVINEVCIDLAGCNLSEDVEACYVSLLNKFSRTL